MNPTVGRGRERGNSAKARLPWIAWALLLLGLAWVARVTLFTRPRAPGQFAVVDASAVVQILFVALSAALLFVGGRSFVLWSRLSGTSGRLLFYYYFVCAASAFWSFLPQYSLYRGVEYIVLTAGMFAAISYCRDFRQAEKLAITVGIIVTALSLTVNLRVKGFPPTLASLHTNSYSAAALLVFCYCAGEYFGADRSRRRILKWGGAASFAFLVIGTSAASNVSAVVGVMIIALMLRKKWLATASGVILIIGVLVIAIVQPDPAAAMNLLFPGKDEKDIMTMTGRTSMWGELWRYFLQNPWVGGGFAVLSSPRGGLYANNPHNSVLAAMVGTGLVGLSLALAFMVKLIRELLSAAKLRVTGAMGAVAALPASLLNSLSKPIVLDEFEAPSLVFAAFVGLFLLWTYRPPRLVVSSRKVPVPRANVLP